MRNRTNTRAGEQATTTSTGWYCGYVKVSSL